VLCQKLLITHRTTSRYHPQFNGLTERLVRTIKGGITRFGTENDRRTWDEWLPYLVMGYCMSNQAALGSRSTLTPQSNGSRRASSGPRC
jgi:transposase InsO family protein